MLIFDGVGHAVPNRQGISFLDSPLLSITRGGSGTDWRPRPRGTWISGITFHTRLGKPVLVRSGDGPNLGWDEVLGGRFVADDRQASCHVAIDADGSFACLADIVDVVTYHAGQVNEVTVGVEMFQASDGGVWESTLRAAVDIADVLTRVLGIQRQFPIEHGLCRRFACPTQGVTKASKLAYAPGGARGRDFCGVFGHRNVTRNRGRGDPGDELFTMLAAAGYEGWNVDQGEDLDAWSKRQHQLTINEDDCDGIAGRLTRRMIAHSGRNACGVWVRRPGDEDFHGPVAE